MSYIIQFKPNVTPKLYNNYLNVYKEVDITDEKVVKGMLDYFESLWNVSKPEIGWEKLLLDAKKSLL